MSMASGSTICPGISDASASVGVKNASVGVINAPVSVVSGSNKYSSVRGVINAPVLVFIGRIDATVSVEETMPQCQWSVGNGAPSLEFNSQLP